MTPITWTHPYGSAWFETAAMIFGVSQRNADYERTGVSVKPMSQTPSSNVIMIVLEREQKQ